MKIYKEGNLITIIFKHGDDFLSQLDKILKKEKITSGVILSGVGMIKNPKLGFYLGKGEYAETNSKECFEVTSMQGNLAKKEGTTFPHIHITIASKNGKTLGGHLMLGTIHNTLELVIWKFKKTKLKRKFDSKTGLFLIE